MDATKRNSTLSRAEPSPVMQLTRASLLPLPGLLLSTVWMTINPGPRRLEMISVRLAAHLDTETFRFFELSTPAYLPQARDPCQHRKGCLDHCQMCHLWRDLQNHVRMHKSVSSASPTYTKVCNFKTIFTKGSSFPVKVNLFPNSQPGFAIFTFV